MKRALTFGLSLSFMASLVACGATPTKNEVVAGQLFCAAATTTGPLVVALANSRGVPVIVTGLASDTVANACKAWLASAVPVTPPAVAVPTVAANVVQASI